MANVVSTVMAALKIYLGTVTVPRNIYISHSQSVINAGVRVHLLVNMRTFAVTVLRNLEAKSLAELRII